MQLNDSRYSNMGKNVTVFKTSKYKSLMVFTYKIEN